jgi:gamma-glutamyltranspeptidase/glutathione hydrolase
MKSQQVIRKTAASSSEAVVVAARMQSAQAACKMLEAGGNAVDAAVSAAFVAGVIEPMETTLAGSGFMLIAMPDGAQVHSVDFGPKAAARARADMFTLDDRSESKGAPGISLSLVKDNANVEGALAMGVPMTFKGLTKALELFGKLPLKVVLEPAIAVAYDGFARDSYYTLEALTNLKALRANPAASEVYLHDGLPPASPDLGTASLGVPTFLRQPLLGKTLETLAQHGADAFYGGELGAKLIDTVKSLGGLLSEHDLSVAEVQVGKARKIDFRGHQVWAPNGPCGAVTMLQILQLWQATAEEMLIDDTARRTETLAQTIWHAFADRYHWLGDPDFVDTPDTALISAAYARKIAELIRLGRPVPRSPSPDRGPWDYFAGHAAHNPWMHQPDHQGGVPMWTSGSGNEPTSGTTHINVIDSQGMMVSLTHTAANIFGSKVLCPQTGLLFDAAMGWFNASPGAANSIAGGKRPLANMGPMLVTKAGKSVAAVGAPGGRRIISAVTQVIINLIERGMSPEDALLAPRIDASGTELLLSERLFGSIHINPDIAPVIKCVLEQHEAFGYELARPLLAVKHTNGALMASGDPFTRNYSIGL